MTWEAQCQFVPFSPEHDEKKKIIHTVPPSLVDTINSDAFLHLLNLQTNKTRIGIPIAVILGKEGCGLFFSSLSDEPSGRLRDEPHGKYDTDTCKALADERNAPLVIGVDLIRAVGNSRSGNGTSKPTAVVETYTPSDQNHRYLRT